MTVLSNVSLKNKNLCNASNNSKFLRGLPPFVNGKLCVSCGQTFTCSRCHLRQVIQRNNNTLIALLVRNIQLIQCFIAEVANNCKH